MLLDQVQVASLMLLRFGRCKTGRLHGELCCANPLAAETTEGRYYQFGCDRIAHLRK